MQLRVSGRDAVSVPVYVGSGAEERVRITAGKLRQPAPKKGEPAKKQ